MADMHIPKRHVHAAGSCLKGRNAALQPTQLVLSTHPIRFMNQPFKPDHQHSLLHGNGECILHLQYFNYGIHDIALTFLLLS